MSSALRCRTLETAQLLTAGLSAARMYVSPRVGPRMFPLPINPAAHVLGCDRLYPLAAMVREFPGFTPLDADDAALWQDGINTLDEIGFQTAGGQLLAWLQSQEASRVFLIAHDGTIINYRTLLGETRLSRADFPGEAGTCRTVLT